MFHRKLHAEKKLQKTFLIFFIIFSLVSCENKIEKAKELWILGKQEEALTKLKEELLKNPDSLEAKRLFEQYNGGSFSGSVIDLFLNKPVDEKITIVAKTDSDIASEQNRINLSVLTNTDSQFIIRNAIPKKRYDIGANMPGYFSTSLNLVAPPRGETKILNEKIQVIKLPYASNGVYMVREYGKDHRRLPNIYFPYGENSPPRPLVDANSIPVYKGNDFIILERIGAGSIKSAIIPVNGIKDELAQSSRISIEIQNYLKTVRMPRGWIIKVFHPPSSLPYGIWALNIYGHGNSYLFRVIPDKKQGESGSKVGGSQESGANIEM